MKQKLLSDYYSINKKRKIDEACDNTCDVETKIYGCNPATNCWHCLICGLNMGINNPRQYCKKTYCDQMVLLSIN